METHHFLGRNGIAPNREPRPIEAFQDPHSLKKFEPVPFFKEYLF